jgi:hypothetical protein
MSTSCASQEIHLAEIDLRPILGLASIARMPASAMPDFVVQTHADPDLANLCMQMFYVLLALGQHEFALEMQTQALQRRCLYRIAGRSVPTIRLLALMGPGDMMDNTPFEFVVENSDVCLDLLFLVPGQALPDVIPDHDIAIVAIGESARNRPLLDRVQALLASWPRPVLNPPQRVLRCARDAVWQLLSDIPGLLIPATQRLEPEQIRGLHFPITIRPVDTHGGIGLAKLDSDLDLDAYLERHLHSEYDVAPYVDYRSENGFFRKARIALIDRQPYVCHLAISDHWMVHYLSAGMELSPDKRAEEAAMMENFDQDFAVRHRAALAAIADRLRLDYVVLDCGEMPDGRLLLFEADSRGWIHATDPVEIFPYKPRVMQKAFDAFRTMLLNSVARSSTMTRLPGAC